MNRPVVVLFGAICVLSLAACGGSPSRSASSSQPTTPASSSPAPATSMPSAAPSTVQAATEPWPPGKFQNGVQLYWHTTGSDETVTQTAQRSLDYITGLGANSVGITFPIYTDGARPTKVYAGSETPSPAQLELVVQQAKQRNLRVMIRPIIDEANIMKTSGAWRGTLRPVDADAWFASYQSLLLQYADMAARNKVDEFVAGTELFSLQHLIDKWKALGSALRQSSFTGEISYSVNWDSPNADSLPFDAIGLDAYPAISLGDDATVEQLTAALTAWIHQQPESVLQKLTLQEAGIPAVSGMYRHPWLWSGNGPQDLALQANWFAAVYQAARDSHLMGVYYWMVDSSVDPSQADPASDSNSSFIKRPAEGAIKASFSH